MNSSPNSERSRLARELHDGLAQELSAIGYQLDSLIGDELINHSARQNLRKVRFSISGVTDQVRDEIYNLRNEDPREISEIIKQQLATLLSNSEILFEVTGHTNLASAHKYEITRCIRELALNSRTHSGCSKITVKLSDEAIKYEDDGSFATKLENNQNRISYGLTGLFERLEKLGFEVSVENSKYVITLK